MYLIRTETGIMSSQAVDLVVILVLMLTNPSLGEQYENTCIQKKHYSETVISYFETSLRGRSVTMDRCKELKNDVVEYRGLPYGDFGQEFQRLGSLSAPRNKTMYASDHNKPCPQRRMPLDPSMASTIYNRWKAIGNFTMDSSPTGECPWINLFVPKTGSEKSTLPVMIFVHGESFDVGTGNAYDGSVLASYGEVIVITVNYRLGVLGFFSTADENAKGNYAMWDLVAVLWWVRQNIQRFNGDPGRITLFGHGHGAALVNMLLVNKPENTDSLYHHVILQSGSALSTWATSMDPVKCARLLARKVNCMMNDSKSLVQCLRNRSVEDLVNADVRTPKYFTCFAPTFSVDGIVPKGDSIQQIFEDRLSKLSSKKIMLGLTTKEAYSYFKQSDVVNGISDERRRKILRTYVQNVFDYNRQKIYDLLDHEYTRWDGPRDSHTRLSETMDLLSDGQYKAPLVHMAQLLSNTTDAYLYSFEHSTFSEDFPEWSLGVHGDELPYVFGAPLASGTSPFPSTYTEEEKELSKRMMRLWTNFAKTGDPNRSDNNVPPLRSRTHRTVKDESWTQYNVSTQSYLQIRIRGSKMQNAYRANKIAFWLNLIPKLNKHCPSDSEATHELRNSNDISSFDEPDGLKSRFGIPPMSTPVTTMNDETKINSTNKPDNTTEPIHTVPPPPEIPVKGVKSASAGSSSMTLSVILVVGCALLVLNMLIFAGIFFQRRKISKMHSDSNHSSNSGPAADNRNLDKNNTAEAVNLVSPSADGKQYSNVHHSNKKPLAHSAPLYAVINKPGMPAQCPGGYSYSALSQKTTSPIHNQAPVSGGAATTNVLHQRSHLPSGHGVLSNTKSPQNDSSANTEMRVRHISRGNPQITSNNAITIV